jgi:hypothetical protein
MTMGVDPYNGHQNPMQIRKVIDDKMNAWKTNGYFDDLIKMKYNTSMVMAISYFMTIFEHRKPQDTSKPLPVTNNFIQVFDQYRAFFKPGSCVFKFEMDSTKTRAGPSPFYHSIEGQDFVHLNWKLMFSTVKLLCFKCKYMKPESEDIPLPLWTHSGEHTQSDKNSPFFVDSGWRHGQKLMPRGNHRISCLTTGETLIHHWIRGGLLEHASFSVCLVLLFLKPQASSLKPQASSL